MQNAVNQTSIGNCETLTIQWFDAQLRRYLNRLDDSFTHAYDTAATADKDALLAQRQRIHLGRNEAHYLFLDYIQKAFSQSRAYTSSGNRQLNRIFHHLQNFDDSSGPEENARILGFCRVITPITVFAGFQLLSSPLGIDSKHNNQALSLFNTIVINELHTLYAQLLKLFTQAGSAAKLQDWLNHCEQQLASSELSSLQRAFAENRLRTLRSQQQTPSPRSAQPEPPSKELLIDQAATIFRDIGNRKHLPTSVLASLNTLQTYVSNLALRDGLLFLNPLHPAREFSRQIVAALASWDDASSDEQAAFSQHFKTLCRHVNNNPIDTAQLSDYRDQLNHCCELLNKTKTPQKTYGSGDQRKIARLRNKIHNLLDNKCAATPLPDQVNKVLYGPLTTVMLYHWLKGGGNSQALRSSLKLVDDIVAYRQYHISANPLSFGAKDVALLESNLVAGLKRVNLDQHDIKSLIEELKQAPKTSSQGLH